MGVLSKVVYINVDLSSRDQNLQLIVIKRPQPVNVYHVVQTAAECLTVWTDLQTNNSVSRLLQITNSKFS